MEKTRNRWLLRVPSGGGEPRGSQGGQSLIIIILALIALLAFVGLGIDLGLVYVERVRLARAADAAALAGVSELPLEAAAQQRALIYLQENGYDFTNTDGVALMVDGVISDTTTAWLTTTIMVDTAFSRADLGSGPVPDTASRIRVRVRQQVPMTFLQFVGFRKLAVEGMAEAENITDLDVVIVFDRSGSMQFDTVSYGYRDQGTGDVFPLPWSSTSSTGDADHCAGWDSVANAYTSSCADPSSYVSAGFGVYEEADCAYRSGSAGSYEYYIVIEAEEYSYANHGDAPYNPVLRRPFQSYWAVQHNDQGSEGRDGKGYIRHHPFRVYGDGPGFCDGSPDGNAVSCTWDDLRDPDPTYGRPVCRRLWATAPAHSDPDDMIRPGPEHGYPTPRVDYDFLTPASITETYHIWIRAEGGECSNGTQHIFWGLDEEPGTMAQVTGLPDGTNYDGAANSWQWRELGTVTLGPMEVHELNLWAGAAGSSVDRIVITTESSVPADIQTADANKGRTRGACNPCDMRFGGRSGGWNDGSWYYPDCPIDVTADALYDGPQPLGDSKNAVKRFIDNMDFRYDQVGYVSYSDNVNVSLGFEDLQCLRQDPANCGDEQITSTVVADLLNTQAAVYTNIADGIKWGMDVLEVGSCSGSPSMKCGRPGSAHIMVVMTDGQPNKVTGDACWKGASAKLWPPLTEDTDTYHQGADCAMYWADRAGDAGYVIYTITIGDAADMDLMKAIAEEGGGEHFPAGNKEQLDWAFEQLIDRIFIRLVR